MEGKKFERPEQVGQTKTGSGSGSDWRKKALYNWGGEKQQREVAQIAPSPHGPEQAVRQDRNEPYDAPPPDDGLPSYAQAASEKVNLPHENVPEAPLTVNDHRLAEKLPEIREDLQPNGDNMPQRTTWQKFVNVAKKVISGEGDRPARTEEKLRQVNKIRRDISNDVFSPSGTLDLPSEVQLKLAERLKTLGNRFVEQFGPATAGWGEDTFRAKLARDLLPRRFCTEAGQRACKRQADRKYASSQLENVCRELGEIRSNCKSVQDLRDIINEAGDHPLDNKRLEAAIYHFDQTLTGPSKGRESQTQFEEVRAEVLERYLPTWMPNPDRGFFKPKEWNDFMTAVHEHPYEAAGILDKLNIVTNQRELKAAWNRIPEKRREEYDRGGREMFEYELRTRTFDAAKAFAAMKNGSFQDRSDKKEYARDLRAFSVISADLPDRPQETHYPTVEVAPSDYDDKKAVPRTRDRSDEKKQAKDLKAVSDFSADLADDPQETHYPTVEVAPPPDYDDKQAVPHTRDRSDKKKSDAQDKRAAFNQEVSFMLTHIERLRKIAQELEKSKSNGDKTINYLIQQTNYVRKWTKEKTGDRFSDKEWKDYRKNRRNPDKNEVVAASADAYLEAALLTIRGRFPDAWDLNRGIIRE
jgi:hypothetical protein